MAPSIDTIWAGDKLERKTEARILARFLTNEAETLGRLGRNQAFVLAIDAQYGEGKSWFLTRFRQQQEINHPVAFVDAWVDDANNEPLVSIMAALEDAMRPFLKKQDVREKLEALTRAALPIMGKAMLGAGGKFISKYLGDQFGDTAKDAMQAAGKKTDEDDAFQIGIDAVVDGVSAIVDKMGAAMLDQYRARQASRETFKCNLRALAASIDGSDDHRASPIFVIVDELDRCRPSYAIALLEEIKHLFDVQGVVFIIALHGQQLTHSINAVYGQEFDSHAYLRRFFTRTYQLRRLSIKELVVSHFGDMPPSAVEFSWPSVWSGGMFITPTPPELAGDLLTEWRATPREAQAVVDALRLFVANWDKPVPIELPLVLVLLLNLVRNEDRGVRVEILGGLFVQFAVSSASSDDTGRPNLVNSANLFATYEEAIQWNMGQILEGGDDHGLAGYARRTLSNQFSKIHGNIVRQGARAPVSIWSEYPDLVRTLGRFVERQPEQEQLQE